MLSGLRLRLTLLYLGVGLAFLALVSVGTLALLRGYYRQSTDLALQHRLVQQLTAIGATVPEELAKAEEAWNAGRNRPSPVSAASPSPSAESPSMAGRDESEHEDEDEQDEDEGHGGGDDDSGKGSGLDSSAEDHERLEHELRETYDGELAAIFLLGLGADGTALNNASVAAPLPTPHAEAVARAQVQGMDWRTVAAADGSSVRLLTYTLPGVAGAPVFQLGRPLADQERVLGRLLTALLGLGLVSALLLGAGGWWVAGRSLAPAEAAWRQQQAFVANASHELRTPLTLIRASAEVLARDLAPEGEPRALIDDIVSETDHMSQLVSDLLLLSRLDSGQVQLLREPVPLAALAADLERQFGRLADARRVRFRSEASAGVALADPVRLRQVLLALLDNALRHTPAGGTITLTARRVGTEAILAVADTGSGIPPEHLAQVFDRFYRAAPSGGESGAGLGLALAKALVEAQHGQIRLDSVVGQGTRVTVSLPGA